jgi:hypothetical protein
MHGLLSYVNDRAEADRLSPTYILTDQGFHQSNYPPAMKNAPNPRQQPPHLRNETKTKYPLTRSSSMGIALLGWRTLETDWHRFPCCTNQWVLFWTMAPLGDWLLPNRAMKLLLNHSLPEYRKILYSSNAHHAMKS